MFPHILLQVIPFCNPYHLATTNLFSIITILLFLEFHIMQSLCSTFLIEHVLRFICIVCINILFLLTAVQPLIDDRCIDDHSLLIHQFFLLLWTFEFQVSNFTIMNFWVQVFLFLLIPRGGITEVYGKCMFIPYCHILFSKLA